MRRRLLAVIATGVALLAIVGGACSGDAAPVELATPETATPTATATAAPGTATPTATATPEVLDPAALSGFDFPIAGACLPDLDTLMPNAPRVYRNGVHEGLDFYSGLACAAIGFGTPVLAMADGVVARADLDYVDLTPAEVQELADRTASQGYSDPETLDLYRGRQVWIDHGGGVVTRYAHLSAIAEGIDEGVEVAQGDVVGYVGESGTPESVLAPGTEMHLHAEVRIGDSFLGAGLPADEVRALYQRLFSAPEDEGDE